MKKNVIILTHGWTGSSVFTALVGKAGYWFGDDTFQKVDYNTYENTELVELNNKMIEDLGFAGDREHQILTQEVLDELYQKSFDIDCKPYQDFVEKIEQNQPWIWKDPRLALTIRIWARFLNLDNIAFVILTRDDEQSWITSNLRRHIQSKEFTKNYNHAVTDLFKSFLKEKGKDQIQFEFEDMQLRPEYTIEELNKFLDVELTMEDLLSVYKLPLYKKSKGLKDKLKAWAIYLKNYNLRDNLGKQ